MYICNTDYRIQAWNIFKFDVDSIAVYCESELKVTAVRWSDAFYYQMYLVKLLHQSLNCYQAEGRNYWAYARHRNPTSVIAILFCLRTGLRAMTRLRPTKLERGTDCLVSLVYGQ